MENLVVYLFIASPILGGLLFALLVNWIMNNFKNIEKNENII